MRARMRLSFLPEARDVEIVSFGNEKVIKVNLRKGKAGPFTGCNWKVPFPGPVEHASLSYEAFFPELFDFVKGGKLPGIAGGRGNTGGMVPTGFDGWSVRFMFKEQGTICAYLYTVTMKEIYGDKKFLETIGEPVYLKTGDWNKITLTITMNSPEKEDGIVTARLNEDGLLKLNSECFRRTDKLKIDHILFSCFMGGSDRSYSPVKDQFILFKNFQVDY